MTLAFLKNMSSSSATTIVSDTDSIIMNLRKN